MASGQVKRIFATPFYRGVLPLLRRAGFVRLSAFDWAAYFLQQNRIDVTHILDIGAYDGTTAAHLCDLFPRADVYAFEPAPDTFRTLETRAQHTARIHPFRFAVSNTNGTATLNVNRSPGTNSLLQTLDVPEMRPVLQDGGQTVERVACPMITPDTFCETHNVAPQLIKTDTQGFDLYVLQGARGILKKSVRAVIAEVRFAQPAYKGDTSFLDTLDEFLGAQGFHLLGIPAATFHPQTHRALEADALWVHET